MSALACPHCGKPVILAVAPDSAALDPTDWRSTPIREMDLSTRAFHCLSTHDATAHDWVGGPPYQTAGDIDKASDASLMKIVNFGKKSLKEVRGAIAALKGGA